MTGAELVAHLAKDCEVARDTVTDILRALADTVETELRAGRSASLPGLGAIHVFHVDDAARPVKISWYTEDGLRKRISEALRSFGSAQDKQAHDAGTRRTGDAGKATRNGRSPGPRKAWEESVPAVAGGLSGVPRGRR